MTRYYAYLCALFSCLISIKSHSQETFQFNSDNLSDSNIANVIHYSARFTQYDINFSAHHDSIALSMARRANNLPRQAEALRLSSEINLMRGNLPLAMSEIAESLKINSSLNNKIEVALDNFVLASIHLGIGNYNEALQLFDFSRNAIKEFDSEKINYGKASMEMAHIYLEQNKPDSALLFADEGKPYLDKTADSLTLSSFYCLYGNIQLGLNQLDLCKGYFEKSRNLHGQYNTIDWYKPYLGLSKYFLKIKALDSARVYGNYAFDDCGRKNDIFGKIETALHLYRVYSDAHFNDTAHFYLEQYISNFSRLYGRQSTEQVRQVSNQLEFDRIEREEEQKHKDSYKQALVIGVGLIILVFILLFIASSPQIKMGFIKYSGITVILLFFELINLTLHGFFERLTQGSVWKMLLFLTITAYIISIIHEKVANWLEKKLPEWEEKKRIKLERRKAEIERNLNDISNQSGDT